MYFFPLYPIKPAWNLDISPLNQPGKRGALKHWTWAAQMSWAGSLWAGAGDEGEQKLKGGKPNGNLT